MITNFQKIHFSNPNCEMNARHWKSSIVILLLLVTMSTQAIGQQIIFNKVLPPDGETFSWLNGITQDNNGFMWFATRRGIYSYDGTQMVSYKNNWLNPSSLAHNFGISIFADDDGTIWIGSLIKGLHHFDPETGIFTNFHHDPDDPASLSNDTVTSILRDSDGILWVGTHQGLDQFDPETKKFIHFRHRADDSTSLSFNQVRMIYEDKQGTLWIGTGSPFPHDGGSIHDGGLNRLDKSTRHFTRFLSKVDDINSLISNKVSAIYEDNQGAFWVGTRGGLHKMNRHDGTFERLIHDPSHPEKFSGPIIVPENADWEHITFIHQDAAGSYWYGTGTNGLYYFNPALGKMIRYHASENTSETYSDNGAWCVYTSHDGILWIGTAWGNLFRINPFQAELPYFDVPGRTVQTFYEESDGTFWFGTNQGLIRQDKTTGESTQMLIDNNPESPDNNITSMYGDKQGNMWVSSWGGLARWDKKNENFIRYKNEPGNNKSLSSNNVFCIFEDKESSLWIGTRFGLNLLHKQTGTFKQFNTSLAVSAIYEDNSDNFWIATAWEGQGIYLFNKETGEIKNYLTGASVICFFEDHENVLWVGALQGLFKYDPEEENFIVVSDIYSILGISEITGIQEDEQKNLWIGSAEGIIRINPERNEARIFGKEYGVENNSLVYRVIYKDHNGHIYFGVDNGYFAFNPADINDNSNPPEVVITQFYMDGHIVKPGNGSPLKENILQTKSITLRYNQNNVSFSFAVIDYAYPESKFLFYMMENYEKEWRPGGSERRAYYFNLPSGKYTFRVKGANSSGLWAEKQINIIILPPWWRTWWAYSFYLILIVAGIFAVDRVQRRRLLRKERERTRDKELKQAREIEKAYQSLEVAHENLKSTQAQLIQSEKMASLGELTAGIAHEIQNPLNFVNNFSEVSNELLHEMKEELATGNVQLVTELADDIIQNLEKINHHGKRADAIVKGMLQHSRSSNGHKEPTDINALADEYLRLSYHGLRAKDNSFNASFKTDFDPTLPKINVIPQDIGRVLLNLINNAFYAVNARKVQTTHALSLKQTLPQQTPPLYKPTVIVSTTYLGARIEISVKDNGNGIPASIKDKIFQPFFTTKPTGQGTGLGLSLSYDIVKAHGGSIKINSESGVYTEFIIQLPEMTTKNAETDE
jgi:ligand-binding sensor domain-containing protein/signal transduction histidine kinase